MNFILPYRYLGIFQNTDTVFFLGIDKGTLKKKHKYLPDEMEPERARAR